MIKTSNYSIEQNKEVKVIKRRWEELSQAKGGGYKILSALSRCAGERKDQHSQYKELKDSRQKTKRV